MNVKGKILITLVLVAVSFSTICGDEEEKNKKYQKLNDKDIGNVTKKDIVHAIIKLEKENKFLVQEVLRLEKEGLTIDSSYYKELSNNVVNCERTIEFLRDTLSSYRASVSGYSAKVRNLSTEVRQLQYELTTREVIIGEWYSSPREIVRKGVTTLVFDIEETNTNPYHFTKNSDNLGITVDIPGYYQITGKTVVQPSGEQFSLHLLCDGEPIDKCSKNALSTKKWESVHVNRAVYLKAGSIIKLEAKSDSAIYHLGAAYTRLTIYKLD